MLELQDTIIDYDVQEIMSQKAKAGFTERRTDGFNGSMALVNRVAIRECQRCQGQDHIMDQCDSWMSLTCKDCKPEFAHGHARRAKLCPTKFSRGRSPALQESIATDPAADHRAGHTALTTDRTATGIMHLRAVGTVHLPRSPRGGGSNVASLGSVGA